METNLKKIMKFLFIIFLFVLLSLPIYLSGSPVEKNKTATLPIIYSDKYNFSLFGPANLHGFDLRKYGEVFQTLSSDTGISRDDIYKPLPVTQDELALVHTGHYLSSLNDSKILAGIFEQRILSLVPNRILQALILKPIKYATGGTILGTDLAFKYGWAINLAGGYHHATPQAGMGFSVYSDIGIAVRETLINNPKAKIMIIDLDAHQCNGIVSIFKDDPRIFLFDVYNRDIFPFNLIKLPAVSNSYIDFNFPVKSHIDDQKYLKLIRTELPKAVNQIKPDLIIYDAGTDVYQNDPLGKMDITANGIITRDELVFKNALQNNIPILMVLAGGYDKASAKIIAQSIENLLGFLNINLHQRL